jgi:hypothetical protein
VKNFRRTGQEATFFRNWREAQWRSVPKKRRWFPLRKTGGTSLLNLLTTTPACIAMPAAFRFSGKITFFSRFDIALFFIASV